MRDGIAKWGMCRVFVAFSVLIAEIPPNTPFRWYVLVLEMDTISLDLLFFIVHLTMTLCTRIVISPLDCYLDSQCVYSTVSQ